MLKLDGQLNALIFPTEDSEKFTWQAYDGLPVYTALDRQEAVSYTHLDVYKRQASYVDPQVKLGQITSPPFILGSCGIPSRYS